MEEKERYYYEIILRDCVIPEGLFEIKDREGNFYLIIENKKDVDTITNLLNQQDKRIKELEEENQQLIKALNGEVFINYKLPMENAQLKQQLAESEKNFIIANNLRKNSNEVLLNYKTKKYGLDKTIEELQKMKLSLPEKEWYYKGFENCERQMSSHIADLTLEVKQRKHQLHDLSKKIVEDFYDEIRHRAILEDDYCPDHNLERKYGVRKCLLENIRTTILKKYGGEDE